MSKNTNVSHWIDLVKAGDSAAANHIWQHYFDRLVHSVRARLYGQNRAISDEEDIVLSVFDSFYHAAENGRFPDLSDRDDLWRLLLRMSARKVVDKRRRDQRQRRGGSVQVHSLNQTGDHDSVIEAIGDEPSPEMVLMMQESVAEVFSRLGVGQLREIAGAKLEGYSNAELAERLGCSERTGLIVHVYGIIVISQALLVCTRIKRIDYSKSVDDIRSKLDSLRSGYLRAGVIIGFVWWLMWIPVVVAFGFDAVLHPGSLIVSLVVGIVGLIVSLWLYWIALRASNTSSESWSRRLAGGSIAAAYLALDEIENAQIR